MTSKNFYKSVKDFSDIGKSAVNLQISTDKNGVRSSLNQKIVIRCGYHCIRFSFSAFSCRKRSNKLQNFMSF